MPKRPMKTPSTNAIRVCHKIALGMESQKLQSHAYTDHFLQFLGLQLWR